MMLPGDIDPSRAIPVKPLPDLQDVKPPASEQLYQGWQGRGGQAPLLTGATGFLGAFILRELIDRERSLGRKVYCLVRSRSKADGMDRIRTNLESYRIWQIGDEDCVVPVPGDLGTHRFGLEEQDYGRLARSIDEVYHNAAIPHFGKDYASLRPANVTGTQNVLRFASRFTAKPVHYVSTIGVFMPNKKDHRPWDENDPGKHPSLLPIGYTQSKSVAETLVREAGRRGLETKIYRPGGILGESRTGRGNTRDFISQFIKCGLDLGMFPDFDSQLPSIPVDYVAKATVYLASRPTRISTFHLSTDRPIGRSELDDFYSRQGYKVDRVGWDEFLLAVRTAPGLNKLVKKGITNALLTDEGTPGPFMIDVTDSDPKNVLSELTNRELAGSGVSYTRNPEEVLSLYFKYFQESGFLSRPA